MPLKRNEILPVALVPQIRVWAFLCLGLLPKLPIEAKIDLVWPTPNPAWARGLGIAVFLQEAGSGNPISGSYGSVRNQGLRFHEGIDLKPLRRDVRGEPIDKVFAAMSGIVRHVNTDPARSSYGRYVVVEHVEESPAVYTLYAHLASIDASLMEQRKPIPVSAGQVLGVMGRSAGGYTIPKQRAHLHFEMGLRLTDNFARWYTERGFDSPNYHDTFNGMNLMGFDPLAFYEAHRSGRIRTMNDWFETMQPAVTLHVASPAEPDFVHRYPRLVKQGIVGIGEHSGWRIECDASGIPFCWTPLAETEIGGLARGQVRVVAVDEGGLATQPAKKLVQKGRGEWVLGRDLETVCQLLFGGSRFREAE